MDIYYNQNNSLHFLCNTEQQAIKNKAGSDAKINYVDIDIVKTVGTASENITETTNLITIVIPFVTSGKTAITVYRCHDGAESDYRVDAYFPISASTGADVIPIEAPPILEPPDEEYSGGDMDFDVVSGADKKPPSTYKRLPFGNRFFCNVKRRGYASPFFIFRIFL